MLDNLVRLSNISFSTDKLNVKILLNLRKKLVLVGRILLWIWVEGGNYWMQKENTYWKYFGNYRWYITHLDLFVRQKGSDGGHNGLKSIIEFYLHPIFQELNLE